MRSIELLAPARNLECGIEAIRHGADAVYIGAPRFGARAAAGNSVEDLARLVDYAHLFGVRIYVTINTLLYDEELPAVQALIDELHAIHVDALITQDPRILPPSSDLSTSAPSPTSGGGAHKIVHSPIPLHSSTQQDNRTIDDVRARLSSGYEQTVLARELSLEEIRAIHAAVPSMPLEVFVHGALCVSYSGRCYASEYCFGRSANRGECAQFCRLPFDLEDGEGRTLERQRHLLSLRDMNRSADLEALMDAGVSSFKIEGRLKDVSYVKNITAFYRQRIDAILERRKKDYCRSSFGRSTIHFTPQPSKSFNRGFTDYFLHGRTEDLVCPATPKSIGEFVGMVNKITPQRPQRLSRPTPLPLPCREGSNYLEGHARGKEAWITVQPAPYKEGSVIFSNGDGLCFFTPDGNLVGFRVNRVDEQGRLFPATFPEGLRPGTRLYRNYDAAFERLLARPTAERRIAVRWLLEDHETGFRLTLTSKETGDSVSSCTFEQDMEIARTPQADNIRRQLLRLGDTPYSCAEEDIELHLSDNFFIPASVLANWRRELVGRLSSRPSRPSRPSPLPLPCREGSNYLEGHALGKNSVNEAEDIAANTVEDIAANTAEDIIGSKADALHKQTTPLPTREGLGGGSSLMTCRFCLRHAIGQCLKEHPTLRGPLFLRLADGRRFPLHFDCQRCEMHVLRTLVLCLLFFFGNLFSAQAASERPYGVGYNFRVHADSLLLQEDRPMHWCQGVAQTSDSLWVFRDNHLVVAAVTVIPEDCVDSVWVKVARDQVTMGWTHESDLLASASPDDPISQFIRIFSARHLPWFLAFIAVACLAVSIRYLRRRNIPLLHVHDIPSAYPTLLTSTLAVAATTYAHIQHYHPEQWVQFYFHPTLNPLAQPPELCLFLFLVWLLLLLTVAVFDAAFSLLRSTGAAVFLLTLLAICTLIYLGISGAALLHIYLAYCICGLYIIAAFYHYVAHIRAHYLCGRCGAKLREKGICPHCGAIND